jgi:hypothetical protein
VPAAQDIPIAATDNTVPVPVPSDPHNGPPVRATLSLLISSLKLLAQVAERAREWWATKKGPILASAQFVFETVEKGLDGMPIPGPKAAFGAAAGVIKAVRVHLLLVDISHSWMFIGDQKMDENDTAIEEIVDHVEKMNDELLKHTMSFSSHFVAASPSTNLAERLRKFTEFVSH